MSPAAARAPAVVAVCAGSGHDFSKPPAERIMLVEGLGVDGDAHAGATVQHLWDMQKDPTKPNLRQVHLMAQELFDELEGSGHKVLPGQLGENITVRGLDVLNLPQGTRLSFGESGAVVQVTGLRNPCRQIEAFQKGLLGKLMIPRGTPEGKLLRKAGIMSIVERGGPVAPDDPITVTLPPEPHQRLAVV